jgi:hypothetical protein
MDIVVYGASGIVGRRVCAELDAAGGAYAIAGRSRDRLDALAHELPATEVRVASLDDERALAAAFADARVVVNCAGPLADIGDAVLMAALAARAHYIDLGGDQARVHTASERHDSTARRAGRAVLLGAAVNGALGDLAAAWAAARVCGADAEVDGALVRVAPAPRLAEDAPFDEVAVSYVFDDLVLSPASQRAVFAGAGVRALAWRRDRWESVAVAAERRRVNAGAELGGEREVASFPGGDVLSVPRHVAAQRVQTFVSTSRSALAQRALRWAARAAPFVPRAEALLAPYVPDEAEYARTRFAVVAQARREFAAAQVVVAGHDLYQGTATIAAWLARQLAARESGPIGVRALGELVRPVPALRELASIGNFTIAPSFAWAG